MEQGEIVLYKTFDSTKDFQIEVRVEDDTVWLTQAQMAELFQSTRNNITLHIGNVFKERELEKDSVCKESLHTALDGKKYKTKFYNLDVIISVGYRVKSQRGTQFRIWANKILKEFLLKGYALNHRVDKIEHKLLEHDQKFDMIIKSSLKPTEGIFFDGQIFDAWQFVSGVIQDANESIILIDNYIDDSVLLLLTKRNADTKATIYTQNVSKQIRLDLAKHNKQYDPIEIKKYSKAHDRFLIIDYKTVYHFGASLKDLGKKWFAFSKMELDAKEILNRLGSAS